MRKAEVAQDGVKGDKELNGLIENTVMLPRGIIRTIKCHIERSTQDESLVLPWLVEHARCIQSRSQKGRDGKVPSERLHGKKPTQEFVSFGEKVLAKQTSTDPLSRMNPRYKFGIWHEMRNNSAECFMRNADGVFRAREIRRLEPQSRWDTEAVNSVIGVPWRVDRPEVRGDSNPIPPLPFAGAQVLRERVTKQDIDECRATIVDAQVAMQSRTSNGRKPTQIAAQSESKNASRITPPGAESLDRRNAVVNEALAKEVQRGEQRKKRSENKHCRSARIRTSSISSVRTERSSG